MVPQADPAHHAGRGQASHFVRVEARRAKATQRDESGGRVLGKGAASPSPPGRGLGNAVSSPAVLLHSRGTRTYWGGASLPLAPLKSANAWHIIVAGAVN